MSVSLHRGVRLIESQITGVKKGRDQLEVSVKRESTVNDYRGVESGCYFKTFLLIGQISVCGF